MAKNLVIVESPAKAKTIEKFLGSDFVVKSSFGHIRDLPSKGMNIDLESGNFEPTYEVNPDKKKTVTELKKLAKTHEVWLAADEDREGEAIAWHLCEALGLDAKKTKRIVFHEITKGAITEAVKNPRTVNQPLVDAQQARRVLDRLVGYELSPVLWKKVQSGLSAGRVQSVAVRLIVEREQEIEAHKAKSTFRVVADFDLGGGKVLTAKLPKNIKNLEDAKTFLEACNGADFSVADLQMKPGKKSPSAPFTTSTLQQEASRKLSFGVKKTMMVAQKLYEAGRITYMRTDSVNLSDFALTSAAAEIEKCYGKEYIATRKFKTKNADAQEAHEAIRPTHMEHHTISGDRDEERLYDLIWKRTVASQMAEAQLEKTTATVAISTTKETLEAQGEVVRFDGFLKAYLEGTDDEDADEAFGKMLPPLEVGQALALNKMMATESFTRPKARFTEASLVKKMEEEGIGRPSTYAPTISTIQSRKYVERGDRPGTERTLNVLTLEKNAVTESTKTEKAGSDKGKLIPTDLGEVVTNFLVKFFPDVVDYGFTRHVEEEFDAVAAGTKVWNKMIGEFYKGFHQTIEEAGGIDRSEAQQSRELGTDPKTGKPIIARIGRFGPMIQIGTKDDEEKPKFASIPEGKSMKTITLEDALELFKLPREVCVTPDGEKVSANFGRFGPYLRFGSLFVSIPAEYDPFSIPEDVAQELVAAKKKAEAEKIIQTWDDSDIQVLNGRYGPYITDGKKNAKIPKDKDPKKLTLKQCEKLIKEAPEKKKRFAKKK
jgi:DNA topoisomerase-1